jgi:tRNA-2-methylthio-N6-dimethylallyladenosine synthase
MEKKKRYYIETYGCEMNKSDSLDIALAFEERGYLKAGSEHEADVIVLNTCAVRENAEDRIAGRLGYYRSLKRGDAKGGGKNGPVVVLAGCMAQERGKELLHLYPEIDVVSGTYHALDIPGFVDISIETCSPLLAVDEHPYRFSPYRGERAEGYRAWVTIVKGCSNYCSYCIVPYLRGTEVSKASGDVVREVEELAGRGVVEVTLLGQNVNTYGKDSGDQSFVDLLERLETVDGIRWIRFLTSHPKDFSPEMVRRIAGLAKVCKHFHLPLQSGSDRILELMNRRYTVGDYFDLVGEIRRSIPHASITTDLIVGFPQEREDDFRATLEAVRRAEFDDAFTYRYSERPFTAAHALPGKVHPDEAGRRLEELIALQRAVSLRKNQAEVGEELDALVERPSKKDGSEYLCKTEKGKMVIVGTSSKGFIRLRVTGMSGSTLRGVEIP